jgi:hypothetical protein
MNRIQKTLHSKLFGIALLLCMMAVAPLASSACRPVLGLSHNQFLDRGQAIGIDNMLIAHQGDGNVVAYADGRAVWATGTAGRITTRLIMQSDGNLVLYGPGTVVWASNTSRRDAFIMNRRCDATGAPSQVGLANLISGRFTVFTLFAYF